MSELDGIKNPIIKGWGVKQKENLLNLIAGDVLKELEKLEKDIPEKAVFQHDAFLYLTKALGEVSKEILEMEYGEAEDLICKLSRLGAVVFRFLMILEGE